MSDFQPQPLTARQLVDSWGLKIWRHRGVEGVNVHDEQQMRQLEAAGAVKVRAYQPEILTNPERLAWECLLPEEPDELGDETG